MAYAAVISVMHTIQRLLKSSRVSIASSSLEIIQSAYTEFESLQQVLTRLDDCISSSRRKRMSALDREIREAVSKLEDAIEISLSDYFLPQFEESIGDENCSIALFSVDDEEIQTLIETVKKMKEEYAEELGKPSLPEEDDSYAVSCRSTDFAGKKVNIFGLSDYELAKLKNQVTEMKNYEFRIESIVLQGDINRTIVGKLICEKAYLERGFERCAMVKIGREYQVKDILTAILSQIDYEHDQKVLVSEERGDESEKLLGERLYTCLKGSRYLIVLDDIWEIKVWNMLRSSFPKEYYGSRVILMTSLVEVIQRANNCNIYELTNAIEDEGWNIIRELKPASYQQHRAEIIAKIQLFLSEAYDEMSEDDDDNNEMPSEDITEDLQLHNSFHGGDVFPTTDSAEKVVEMMFNFYSFVDLIMCDETRTKWNHGHHRIQSLLGMAGIGKTTLARDIFEDPSIQHRYDLHVWVTLGPNYQSENILADILAQIDPDIDNMHMMKGDEMLAEQFWTKASHKTCLIVLDDVWSVNPLNYLHKLFENIKCEVLLTTTLKEVAGFSSRNKGSGYGEVYQMRLLNKDKSWHFLREKVFAENLCPPELEKPGMMIAEDCEGLPLMIATVASFLAEADKTLEYWTEVAKKQNLVFEHAYDEISEKLYPTYEYLPQFLKGCFLYMGVFPQKYKIPVSKLLKLMSFEEIIEEEVWTFEHIAMEYVTKLVSRSLLLKGKTSSSFGIKSISLHSVYWHLCIRVARKIKFFHVLNRYSDGFGEHINGQRRLCIQNNVLFGLKDVHDSMSSISTTRSLLCTGPSHPYSVPICLGFGLLKVLDALTIRFYEFPTRVVHLVHLRYLGLTYDGKLPPSISKLRNLECLIVRRHLHTKLYGAPLYLPMEIWDMKELKHLQVMGSELPDPCGTVLLNLTALLDTSAHSVMEDVLRGTPNLKKLGIRIELTPNASEPVFSYDHLYHLDRLESLKCVVVNPDLIRYRIDVSPPPFLSLPSSLEKLTLSGFGYPWEHMRTIAELPYLKVLKLRCYAFRGPEWVMREGDFQALSCLLLEDADVEYLKTHDDCFFGLKCLIIRHCYKLKSFPMGNHSNRYVELDDCSASASNFTQEKYPYCANIHSTWDDRRKARGTKGTLEQDYEDFEAKQGSIIHHGSGIEKCYHRRWVDGILRQ